MDLVSILIPVYNREEFISECIESALEQDYKNKEIIISDNFSQDKTWEIVKSYKKKHPKIIINRNDKNIGPIPNWIKCFKMSKGKWIKLLFSDDKLLPTHISNLIGILKKYEFSNNITGIFCPVYIFDNNGKSNLSYTNNKPKLLIEDLLLGYLFGIYSIPVSPCAGIFRRDIVSSALEWKPQSAEAKDAYRAGFGVDMMMYLLSTLHGVLLFSNEPTAMFRAHKSSISISSGRIYSNWGYKSPIIDIIKNLNSDEAYSIALIFSIYNLLRNRKDTISISYKFLSSLCRHISFSTILYHTPKYSGLILKEKIRRLI